MKDKILKHIKFLVPERFKQFYRKYHRRYIRTFKLAKEDRAPLKLEELEHVLREKLKIQKGDTLLVHSSFGNLNAAFSPSDVIGLLKAIVGDTGNILMPFYPTGHAFYWIQKDENIFDVNESRSSMGILTQVFKESAGVKVSPHPVKSLAVWGKDRDLLIEDHYKSLYPYDKNSPYYKCFLLPNSKSLGLGIEINSFFHSCEDLFLRDKSEIYSEHQFKGRMNYYDGFREVKTYLHDPQKVNSIMTACTYLKLTNCQGYISHNHKGAVYYAVPNKNVFEHTRKHLVEGNSRTVLTHKQ
jgi:aminoglycoside 3-N-acetyltransferase